VRRLADCGHTVYASDTFVAAPGSHSRYLAGHAATASPRRATDAFIADGERIVDDHGIDTLVPSFEEAFYLAPDDPRSALRCTSSSATRARPTACCW
jgi:hypothetical protein